MNAGKVTAAAKKQEVLRPAPAEAHKLHLQRGWSCARIAAIKGIKESTAENYVADAMRAGRAYRFSALGVPQETLVAVRQAWETLKNAAEAAEAAAAVPHEAARDVGVGVVDSTAGNAIVTPALAPVGTLRAMVSATLELLEANGTGEVPSYSRVSFAPAHLQRLEISAEEAGNAPSNTAR